MRRLVKLAKQPHIRSAQSLGLNFSPVSVTPSIRMSFSLWLLSIAVFSSIDLPFLLSCGDITVIVGN